MKSASNNSNPTICLHVFLDRGCLQGRLIIHAHQSGTTWQGMMGWFWPKFIFPDIAGDFPSKKATFWGPKRKCEVAIIWPNDWKGSFGKSWFAFWCAWLEIHDYCWYWVVITIVIHHQYPFVTPKQHLNRCFFSPQTKGARIELLLG